MAEDNPLWGPTRIVGSKSHVKAVRKQLNAINNEPLGRKLFEKLNFAIKNKEPIEIKGEGANTMKVCDEFKLTRSNRPYLIFDPNYVHSTTFDPTQKIVVAKKKNFVYLFHELIHCLDVLNAYTTPLGVIEEEFKATGLFDYETLELTENALRKSLNLPRRPVYCWLGVRQIHVNTEKARRKALGLPESPRDYLRNIEDNFVRWEAWKRNRLQALRKQGKIFRQELRKSLARIPEAQTFGHRSH